MKPKTMSGAEMKERFQPFLNELKDDDQVIFGAGDLSFSRFKDRGPKEGPRLVQIEFKEIYSITEDFDAPL